jgi:hypothetical protein
MYNQVCAAKDEKEKNHVRKAIEESQCSSKMKGILFALLASPFDTAFEYFTHAPYLHNPKKRLPVELLVAATVNKT